MTPRAQAARIALLYFSYFVFLGVNVVYGASWLASRGFGAGAIGAALAAMLAAKTVGQPLLGLLGDHLGRRRVLLLAGWGALVATTLMALAPSPPAILAWMVIAGLFTGGVLPLADALALADPQLNYGRIRLWGSVGFALANIGAGALIDAAGRGIIIWLEVAALTLLALAALSVPGLPPPVRGRRLVAELRQVMALPITWLFICGVAVMNASHAFYYAFSVLHWRDNLGYGNGVTGLLWATGVAAEVVLMAVVGARAGRRLALVLLFAGGIGGMLRWTATALDPPLALLFAVQMLHAASYGAMHMGAMLVLRAAMPPAVLTGAMGIYTAVVNGVAISLATAPLGAVYAHWGGAGYALMALLSAVGLVIVVAFARVWSGGRFAAIGLPTSDRRITP